MTKRGEWDVHIATQGLDNVEQLEAELKGKGFHDDRLLSRQLTFLEGSPMSSCPLIGIHMTKKGYSDFDQVTDDMEDLYRWAKDHGVDSYAHAEFTRSVDDVTLQSAEPYVPSVPWPFAPFEPMVRDENKKWDLHIAVPRNGSYLDNVMSENGLYYIDVMKHREGIDRPFRVYTIQGVNDVREGREVFGRLKQWLEEARVPHAEMKLEVTVDMWKLGDPKIVPPTIDRVEYKS